MFACVQPESCFPPMHVVFDVAALLAPVDVTLVGAAAGTVWRVRPAERALVEQDRVELGHVRQRSAVVSQLAAPLLRRQAVKLSPGCGRNYQLLGVICVICYKV